MTALTTLSPATRQFLDDFVHRGRRVVLFRAAAWGLSIFLAWGLICCLIDRYAHLPAGARILMLSAGLLALGYCLMPRLLAYRRRADWKQVAVEVEGEHPQFAQRLITVTSRVLGATTYRGSDEILMKLVREVDEEVAVIHSRSRLPLPGSIVPFLALVLLVLLTGGLVRAHGLRFGQLAGRFVLPLADIPPVTTTILEVEPGDQDAVQSQPLTIDVRARQLGEGAVNLFINEDGRNWSRVPMTALGGDHFVFTLAAVDRDLKYYVTGGDAQSPQRLIRVLRRPTIARFDVHYDYPAYTRLPPATVSGADGRIDAPAGTKVSLEIHSTEPLQAALLTIGSTRTLMRRTSDDFSRQADFVVANDSSYSIDLISTREVAGSAPPSAFIHASPDLPPQVRLARGGDTLHLNPRDILPVAYEAADDYGLKSLTLSAQVNGQEPSRHPLRLWGDSRWQHDVFPLDFATLPLGIGDVVTINAEATDTAGHTTRSEPLRVSVAPRSIDLDAYQRVLELGAAAELSRSLIAQLDEAVKAGAEADGIKDHQSAGYLGAVSRGDRALTAASQTGTLLRQTLLRAITENSRPELSVAMAGWIDGAVSDSAAADEAFRKSGRGQNEGRSQDAARLRQAVEQARQLQLQLASVLQGERAAAILADHQNLLAARTRPPSKDENERRRARETLERMRQDFVAETRQAGLDPAASDLDNQLTGRVSAETDLLKGIRPVAFGPALRDWAAQMKQTPPPRLGMGSRLSAAAQAEAVRPDADLSRARDLELVSRIVGALTTSIRGGKPAPAASLDGLGDQVESLDRWRESGKTATAGSPSAEQRSATAKAAAIREQLVRLADDAEKSSIASKTAPDETRRDAEQLALAASAAGAEHQYARAAEIDRMLAHQISMSAGSASPAGSENPATRPATAVAPGADREDHRQSVVRQEMETAHRLDDLGQQQQQLIGRSGPSGAADLVGEQRTVADQIARVNARREDDSTSDSPATSNYRERAASETLAVQEQLSSLPQSIASARTMGTSLRDAAMRAAGAKRTADEAPPEQRDAARRAAVQAGENVKDAAQALAQAMGPISAATKQMAARLEPFTPETDSARAVITGRLGPALEAFAKSVGVEDDSAAGRAAEAALEAVETSQRELLAAQDEILRRDPLTAARWFARAAADSLSLSPPDIGHATLRQQSASVALSRAWDQSIHRAAKARLASVPSLESVLDPTTPVSNRSAKTPQQSTNFPAAREWGRLRPPDGSEMNATMHESDPAGYEESLRLYFEALGKAQPAK